MLQRTIDQKQMNITIVLGDKIPSIKYGGTQRVMWYLGKELDKRGHKVTFIAGKGSYCPFAKVIELDPAGNLNAQIPADTDLVHFNIPVPDGITKPHLLTIHGNGIPANADRNIVFDSRNHAQRLGSESFVYNGLDWDDYGPANLTLSRKNYHFLGKAAWKVKNMKGAIAVVESIKNAQLDVLGGYRLNLKMGFRFTWNPRIHFHGMVDDSKKKGFIEQSRGLIFPVTWHEPFGLAITESLYFGAPVFGTPYGALPELVPPEVGFLTTHRQEMAEHIQSAQYSPKVCHEYARDLFNSSVMAEAYLKKYETVLNGEPLNKEVPHVIDIARRLPWD